METSGCTSVASERIWALTVFFSCDGFQSLRDVEYESITSHITTDVFVTISMREMPKAFEFDKFDLDKAVIGLTDFVNLIGGFIVQELYKPSMYEGVVQDV